MNATSCPRCGSIIPVGASFCMHCGVSAAASTASLQSPDTGMPVSRTHRLLWGAVALASILALGFALTATGVLKFGSRPSEPFIRSPGQPAPAVIKAPASNTPTGVTMGAPPEGPTMPANVKAWLEHLRKCEERRVSLSQDQLAAMMVIMTKLSLLGASNMLSGDLEGSGPPPSEELETDVTSRRGQWASLVETFNSLPPPAECVPVRNSYEQALRETGGMMMDLLEVLNGSAADPQNAISTLMKMQGKSEGRIDMAAESADEGVQKICDRYDTRKWFKIVRDVGGGGLMKQFSGLPNIPGQ